MPVSRKNKKNFSKKRKNVKRSKKTRKHIRKMKGGGVGEYTNIANLEIGKSYILTQPINRDDDGYAHWNATIPAKIVKVNKYIDGIYIILCEYVYRREQNSIPIYVMGILKYNSNDSFKEAQENHLVTSVTQKECTKKLDGEILEYNAVLVQDIRAKLFYRMLDVYCNHYLNMNLSNNDIIKEFIEYKNKCDKSRITNITECTPSLTETKAQRALRLMYERTHPIN
jgi:hypothetical protein